MPDICPKCGYNHLQEMLKKVKVKHSQVCYTCRHWIATTYLGSFCGNENEKDDFSCYEGE